ncbi:unnamed protein product [Meganyctiphanes norvegica]|uniref:Uncharacterized protein n=1 Tax=Meganyctiphanes norvegica TaxID=48144 RepID=A0AAV2QAA2_MEGNR
MKLHFLGSGSCCPTTRRGVSSMAMQIEDGSVWLFDCGEGSQIQIQKLPVSAAKINKIFITHLHGDHLFGLPGLLCTISQQLDIKEEDKQNNKMPIIEIYGPLGLRLFLFTSLSLSRSPLAYQYKVHELVPHNAQYGEDWDSWNVDHNGPEHLHPSELPPVILSYIENEDGHVYWKLFESGDWSVNAGWIHHRVPSFGFVLKEKGRQGTIDKDKLISLGIKPGPLYGILKSGHSINVDGVGEVTPEMVLGPSYPGRTAVVLGDTNDATPLAHLVDKCDVLVHEATHDDALGEKASEFGHSTPSQAAAFAKCINANVLLLNHFSQRYKPISQEMNELADDDESVAILEAQAKNVLQSTNIQVLCADDLFIYPVPKVSRLTTK